MISISGPLVVVIVVAVIVVAVAALLVVRARSRPGGQSALPGPPPSEAGGYTCPFCKRPYDPAQTGGRCPGCHKPLNWADADCAGRHAPTTTRAEREGREAAKREERLAPAGQMLKELKGLRAAALVAAAKARAEGGRG